VKRRAGLFIGYWFDLAGKKLKRVTRAELAIAYRLWSKHADIRIGKAQR
jgi:hypothetical protein